MRDSVSVSTTINAPADKIWAAITDPKIIKSYFFDADVKTDWKPGSPITWSGEFNGKPYQDKGMVKVFQEKQRLSVSHWSPMSGLEDQPGNYHTVTYDLEPDGGRTKVTLTQDKLLGMDEEDAQKNWRAVLEGLKHTVTN
jgi:uncharacterized protein YndB with AHSA1/START domain